MAYGWNFCKCMLVYLDCTKYDEMNIHFSHSQKHSPTEYGMNRIHNLSTGHTKEFGYISDCSWKLLKIHFILFYAIFIIFKIS